ncbi:hypothetical protein BDN70DRAFT_894962 [Pholiota conissans]|uniref:Uncharacterized protein n=1 Tax=Pholiota conissans TaxID=109636 RepID=A0A9P6D0J0_9AGAR|nr:hypothetical protein BDN70DRAFT_894962 [Pholiota conissans]
MIRYNLGRWMIWLCGTVSPSKIKTKKREKVKESGGFIGVARPLLVESSRHSTKRRAQRGRVLLGVTWRAPVVIVESNRNSASRRRRRTMKEEGEDEGPKEGGNRKSEHPNVLTRKRKNGARREKKKHKVKRVWMASVEEWGYDV